MKVVMIDGEAKVSVGQVGTVYKGVPFEVSDEIGALLISKRSGHFKPVLEESTKVMTIKEKDPIIVIEDKKIEDKEV